MELKPCPGCDTPLPRENEICTKCGTIIKEPKEIKTVEYVAERERRYSLAAIKTLNVFAILNLVGSVLFGFAFIISLFGDSRRAAGDSYTMLLFFVGSLFAWALLVVIATIAENLMAIRVALVKTESKRSG